MVKYGLVASLSLYSLLSFGQYEMPKKYEWSPLVIDVNKGADFGSGIFYTDTVTKSLYIITAKHVIEKYMHINKKQKELTNVVITFYTSNEAVDSVNKGSIYLNLYEFQSSDLIKLHSTKDIAVIKVGNALSIGYKFFDNVLITETTIRSNQKLTIFGMTNVCRFQDVATTRDVFVFGYPKTIGLEKNPQYDFNAPLIQKGIISAKDFNRRSFIINCPVYGGNSGGPVVQVKMLGASVNLGLIGIVTEFVPYIDKETNLISNSGYTVVTPIEYALELMN